MARLHRISYRPGDTVVFEHKGRIYQGVIGAVEVEPRRDEKVTSRAKVSVLLSLETFNDVTTAAEIR